MSYLQQNGSRRLTAMSLKPQTVQKGRPCQHCLSLGHPLASILGAIIVKSAFSNLKCVQVCESSINVIFIIGGGGRPGGLCLINKTYCYMLPASPKSERSQGQLYMG